MMVLRRYCPDPLVWDQGGRKKTRRTDIRVNGDLANLPGPPSFLSEPWMPVHGGSITGADIAGAGGYPEDP